MAGKTDSGGSIFAHRLQVSVKSKYSHSTYKWLLKRAGTNHADTFAGAFTTSRE